MATDPTVSPPPTRATGISCLMNSMLMRSGGSSESSIARKSAGESVYMMLSDCAAVMDLQAHRHEAEEQQDQDWKRFSLWVGWQRLYMKLFSILILFLFLQIQPVVKSERLITACYTNKSSMFLNKRHLIYISQKLIPFQPGWIFHVLWDHLVASELGVKRFLWLLINLPAWSCTGLWDWEWVYGSR